MKGRKKSKDQAKILDEQQEFIKKISAKIRQMRVDAGYTSHETFAYDNDFDRTQWSKIERGVDMKLSTLHRALQALNISPSQFFEEFE